MIHGSTDVRPARRVVVAVLVVGLAVAATSCSTHHRATHQPTPSAGATATGHASIGPLTITGGYIPQPASPDVAAAYLTITNTGDTPDAITTITTNVTAAVMAMNETEHNGVGTMSDVHTVTIPAHGRVSFTPGRAHLMLQSPTRLLRAGQRVTATITFARAGTVTITMPVVPLTATEPTPSLS